MSFQNFKENKTRDLVSKTLDTILSYVDKKREPGLMKLVNISEKLMGDKFRKEVFDSARELIKNPDAKWMKYANSLMDDIDPHVIKTTALNLGYQAGFYGYSKMSDFAEKNGYRLPWIILMDPTSACNKHCTGCWAAEYGHPDEPFLRGFR